VTMMLTPDLLDRRALALIRLIDVYGRPVEGPVRIESAGVRSVAKKDGEFAILAAPGLESHVPAFDAPPPTPALASQHILLDLTPVAARVAPRRFDLALPRDPKPANAAKDTSLFRAAEIEMLPSPRAGLTGSACALRVTVRRKDDKRLVENALVRAQSDNGLFAARALTDARGEACLIFATLPLSFVGAGGKVVSDLAGKAVAHADPASARFHAQADLGAAAEAASLRTVGHADPDSLASAFPPAFESGAVIRLAAGRQAALTIEWEE
jgi:hypothetical protein